MIQRNQQQDTGALNQSHLQTLCRTLKLSEGQFSLLLARCNYTHLREQIVDELRQHCSLPIDELHLSSASQALYSTIQAEVAEKKPAVLMVYGLEFVSALDEVLDATNLAREAFLNLSFPVVLWINDKLWKTLNRRAPDFTNWATSYEFVLSSEELIRFLEHKVQDVFSAILEIGATRFVPNSKILGSDSGSELELAYRDLKQQGIELDSALEARLKFVLGRHYYALTPQHPESIQNAIQQYEQSLAFWQQNPGTSNGASAHYPLTSDLASRLIWQGVLQFHLGLCYAYRAEQHRNHSGQEEWETAREHLQHCIDRFEAAERQDLVAKFINKLGEALRCLNRWDELWELAVKSRKLHEDLDSTQVQLAQDYGFLAEVALNRLDWNNAKELANVALDILTQASTLTPDEPIKNQHQGLYLLILAQALNQLGLKWEAIEKLEAAYNDAVPKFYPKLYLQILEMLRRLYFELGDYKEAFKIKKEYRTIQNIFGYNAFIGAERLQPREQAVDPTLNPVSPPIGFTDEITASGREEAIHQLLQRMASPQHKLTVIYGQSGVGKSSILRAGLIPALQQRPIEARIVIPIVLKNYNSFACELERKLSPEHIKEIGNAQPMGEQSDFNYKDNNSDLNFIEDKLNQVNAYLKYNAEHNYLTVLIFDQFEEFLFTYKYAQKKKFFEFLRTCLNLPYTKVILAIREDYLHYLLESSRAINLEVINNDILSKNILFYLGNFSQEEAFKVIDSLTQRAHFYLEENLIHELVKDLAEDSGLVRPIELQVVGAQLQAEKITTLVEYRKKGPKHKLVERFLEEVIQDCGAENEKVARLVLYSLTDENNTRPLKTRTELAEDLRKEFEHDVDFDSTDTDPMPQTGLNSLQINQALELVLYILEKSGLVYREVGLNSAELYQLVHDYLAGFIRQQHRLYKEAEFEQLQQENEKLKEERKAQEEQLKEERKAQEARDKKRQIEEELQRIKRNQTWLGILVALVIFGLLSWIVYKRGQTESERLAAINSAKQALLLSNENDQLGVLLASLRLGIAIKESIATPEEQDQIAKGLRPVIASIQERNRLEGHTNSVLGVSFSPDGQLVATASNDKTVKLWRSDGQWIRDLPHDASVKSVRFSPNGKLIATTSEDNTIKLWTPKGELLQILKGHTALVTSVSFNSQGIIASSSYDNTIKLWQQSQGEYKNIKTIKGHQKAVLDVEFSPNNQTLASASRDGTVKLWKMDGSLIRVLNGNSQTVYDVSFSPNGQLIVGASGDRTIKIWDQNTGREIVPPLKGHNEAVLSVSFSPKGNLIASGSRDRTVKVWNLDGTLLSTFIGHKNDIWAVSFSPDGQFIASASADNTVKLWDSNNNPLDKQLQGHDQGVWSVNFSPDGQTLATASDDKTVKLWNHDGTLQKTLQKHQGAVNSVKFSPNGQFLATASDDKTVKLWTGQGDFITTFAGHRQAVNAITFSPDGETIASASADQTVKIWSPDGRLLQTLPHDNNVWDVQFNREGNYLATAIGSSESSQRNELQEYKVKLWFREGKTWKSYSELLFPDSVRTLSFTPNPGKLAVATGNTVRLWSRNQNNPESCPLQHDATVQSLSFSSDGQVLATASDDKKVRLWQIDEQQLWPEAGCQEIKPFFIIEQNDFINSVSFSPNLDRQTLAIGKDNGTVILWGQEGLKLDSQISLSCRWLQDYLQTNINIEKRDRKLCPKFEPNFREQSQ